MQWRLFIMSCILLLQVHRASSCCWYGRSCTSIPQVRTLLSRTYLCLSISSYTLLALTHIPLLYQRSAGSSSSSNNNSVLPPSMSDALGKGKSTSTGTVYVPCTPVGRNLTSVLSIVLYCRYGSSYVSCHRFMW